MYTSFAEGDIVALRKICTDGLYDSFRARIGNRSKGEKVVWDLVNYNKRSKLISNRAARMPIEGAAVMQAVVRDCVEAEADPICQGQERWDGDCARQWKGEGCGRVRGFAEAV
jgi:hypothetical protein